MSVVTEQVILEEQERQQHEVAPAPTDVLPGGNRITGPAALAGGWVRFWHLTFNIAKNQWKMRFFGSVLGYFWQLMRPLLLFGVLYIFWTQVVNIDKSVPGPEGRLYGVQLLGGIVMYTFLQEATMGAVRAVVDNEQLVRKIHFPRLAIPIATVLVSLFNLGLNLVVVFIFGLASGIRPMWSWFELLPVVALLTVLALGCAMLVSAAFVYFRDIQPIWEVVLQVLFYASPVMIPMYVVSAHLRGIWLHLYMLNPMAVILEQFKHGVVNHAVYGPSYYCGYAWELIPIVFVFFVFGLGFYVFNRMAPNVAENI